MSDITAQKPDHDMIWVEKTLWEKTRRECNEWQAHVAALRAALEPFAEAAKYWVDAPGTVTHDNVQLWQRGRLVDYLTCGHLRAAEAALAATPAEALEAVGAKRAARELRSVSDRLRQTASVAPLGHGHDGLLTHEDGVQSAIFVLNGRAAELDREAKCAK